MSTTSRGYAGPAGPNPTGGERPDLGASPASPPLVALNSGDELSAQDVRDLVACPYCGADRGSSSASATSTASPGREAVWSRSSTACIASTFAATPGHIGGCAVANQPYRARERGS